MASWRRRFAVIGGAAALAFVAASPAQAQAETDSALVARIAALEVEFFQSWRRDWRTILNRSVPEEPYSNGRDYPTEYSYKYRHLRCPTGGNWAVSLNTIHSGLKGAAVCPFWFGPTADPRGSSAASVLRVEPTLETTMRVGPAAGRRTQLLTLLDSAERARPDIAWIVGQRVRFLVVDRDFEGALRVARRCTAGRWWCSALAGYALHRSGDWFGADSAFRIATTATSGEARCEWTDISLLLGDWPGEFRDVGFRTLDLSSRAEYRKRSCAERDSLSTIAFWLADPFWSDDLNERRAEHFARKVSVLLHSAVPIDELYNWEPLYGGDARAELVMRYGWPDAVAWSGIDNDDSTAHQIHDVGGKTRPGTPYVTAEYSRTGLRSFVPRWNALLSPFGASPVDLGPVPSANYPWLAEMMRTRSITSIESDQVALLRRDSAALFVYAADLADASRRHTPGITNIDETRFAENAAAIVVRSTRPDSIQRLSEHRLPFNKRLLIRESVPPTRAIMSIEVPDPEGTLLRQRIPISPPPTLSQMVPGDVAMSPPVLLLAPAGDELLPPNPDAALDRMHPTTWFRHGTQSLGVYWETYGIAPGDSVAITVTVQRQTRDGFFARAATALRLRGDRNSPVSIGWTEPQPAQRFHVTEGRVPTVSRSVVLDIRELPPGEYVLEVEVRKGDAPPITSQRSFALFDVR